MNTSTLHEGQFASRDALRDRAKTPWATMLNRLVAFIGGLCLVTALIAAAGLGVWAYSLNTQLTQAHADYLALKNSQEKLNGDFNALNTESAKANANLAIAQAQIASLQSQLKQSQANVDSLNARITAIQAKFSILYVWEFGTDDAFDEKVNAADDAGLKTLWAKYQKKTSAADAWKLQDYMIQSIANLMGINIFSAQG